MRRRRQRIAPRAAGGRSAASVTVQPAAPPPATRGSRRRTPRRPRRRRPTASADRLEQPPVVADDEQRRRRIEHERLDRLAGRDVEVVRRLVEQQHVRGHDPEQRELEPRPLAARERSDLLERVVAAEQEPGEVGARLARRQRDRVEQGVEDRGAARSPRRGAARGSRAGRALPNVSRPSIGGSSPAIVRRSVVFPAPFGPTIPMRSPRCAARNGIRATGRGTIDGRPSASVAPRPGR